MPFKVQFVHMTSQSHSVFSGYDHVYVLDCDIGQSEFTPSGCLSLTKVTSPILDKPYGHQKKTFENSYFYGDNTVTKLPLYLVSWCLTVFSSGILFQDIFERLFNKFKLISEPGSVCIINSMGWVVDVGAEILDSITKVAEPDLFIEIFRDQTEYRYNFLVLKKTDFCFKWGYITGTSGP